MNYDRLLSRIGEKDLTDAERDEIIATYLTTPDKRGLLAQSMFHPGQELLSQDPTPKRLCKMRSMLTTMDQIVARNTGQEYYDRLEFGRLHTELQAVVSRHTPRKTAWERLLGDDLV